jgi:hypothetical protein
VERSPDFLQPFQQVDSVLLLAVQEEGDHSLHVALRTHFLQVAHRLATLHLKRITLC